jgi:membrane-associated phospholipid phosphatase
MNIKFHLILFVALLTYKSSLSQQNGAYKLNFKKDAIAIGLGTGLSLYAVFREMNTTGLSQTELLSLDQENVNAFDRVAIGYSSETAATISDVGLYVSLASSALLLAPTNARKDFKEILVMGIEAVSLNYAATYLTKTLFLRNRPYMYRNQTPFDKTDKDGRFSFISGHASFSAVSLVYVATTLYPYLTNPVYSNLLLASAIAVPTTVAYLRVRAGKHFPTDVIAGFATGAAIGYLVPTLHKSKSGRMSFMPFGTGFSLTYAIY